MGVALVLLAALAVANGSRASDLKAGQKVYEQQCASCHGIDGRPTVAGTPDFTRGQGMQVSDVEMVKRIKAGKGLMPGYDHIISDADVLNVVAYLRALWF